MRGIWFGMLLVLSMGCAIRAQNIKKGDTGLVESQYDEFKKKTVVTYQAFAYLDTGAVGKGGVLRTAAGSPVYLDFTLVAIKESPEVVALVLSSSGEHWSYLKCNEIDLLADDNPVPVNPTKHDGDVGLSGDTVKVKEKIYTIMSKESAIQFTQAKEIRGRICKDTWYLKPSQVAGLQDFAAKAGLLGGKPPSVTPESSPTSNESKP